jgi:uncharacterized protein (PEP-CTERM system associated)
VSDSTFESIVATTGYALSRKFRVFATVGEDRNDFISLNETDGSSYSVGFGWSPTRRTSVEMSAGERFFGKTFSFNGQHQARQSRWFIRYAEDVSDISSRIPDLSEPIGATLGLCPPGVDRTLILTKGDAIANGCQINLFFGTSLVNGVFISKLLTAGTTWDVGSRTRFSAQLTDLTREFQVISQAEDQVQSLSLGVDYRLSPAISANGSLSLTRNSLINSAAPATEREDDILSLNLGMSRRFSEDLSGALTFRHTQRDSNAVNSDYDENSLSASVNMRF